MNIMRREGDEAMNYSEILVLIVGFVCMLSGCHNSLSMEPRRVIIDQQLEPASNIVLETSTIDVGATSSQSYEVRLRVSSDQSGDNAHVIWRSDRATNFRARWARKGKIEVTTDSVNVYVWFRDGVLFGNGYTVARTQAAK